ncbi:MAG: hemolysin III family protein [Pseudomonadota bacterium]
MPYPNSLRETLADASVHLIGVLGAVIAGAGLIVYVARTQATPEIAATSVYAGILIFAMIASALYHLLPWDRSRALLLSIDQAAIYLKIAGTYTPLVVLIGSAFSYVVLAGVWGVALVGAALRLWQRTSDGTGTEVIYLAMGWASLLLIWPLAQVLPVTAVVLIVGGGLLYTVGTLFFRMRALRYQNAIWHSFVLAASACFFGAVSLGVSA